MLCEVFPDINTEGCYLSILCVAITDPKDRIISTEKKFIPHHSGNWKVPFEGADKDLLSESSHGGGQKGESIECKRRGPSAAI